MLRNPLPRLLVRAPVLLRLATAPLFLIFSFGMLGCAHSMPGFGSATNSATSKLYWQDEPGIGTRPRLVITPRSATVQSGQQMLFKAAVTNQGSLPIQWMSTAGTISPQGLFIAPTVSTAKTVTITATGVSVQHLHPWKCDGYSDACR